MRLAITPSRVTLDRIKRVCQEPIDALLLREKSLEAKELFLLAEACRLITKRAGLLLIIHERLDIALAAGADGIHLPQGGITPSLLKPFCPDGFLIGVSTHTFQEAIRAYESGASYLTYSSPTKGKEPDPAEIRALSKCLPIPILPLGSLDQESLKRYLEAGSCGYAAIRMFFS